MRVNALAMLMPEAASNFDDLVDPGKDEIGFAGEGSNMKPVPEAHAVNQAAHQHFWRCILRQDFPHVFGATLWIEIVCHTAKSSGRSEISFNRFPLTIISSDSSESDSPNSFTVSRNSGSAKW